MLTPFFEYVLCSRSLIVLLWPKGGQLTSAEVKTAEETFMEKLMGVETLSFLTREKGVFAQLRLVTIAKGIPQKGWLFNRWMLEL
jgi:hypothetical protein